MIFAISFRSLLRPVFVTLTACLLAFPAGLRAADVTNETGVRLLEIELLPSKVTLRKVKCEPLIIAVTRTTLAHPHDAVSILDAALTRRVHKLDQNFATLPCTCARQIFLASVAAAPKRSSDFLDLAIELYPDCTPEFAAALADFGAGRTATGANGANSPGSPTMNTPMGDFMIGDPLTPGSDGGFGVGFGPGFPGSPGFTGSSPSGGMVLPPAPTTSVVNG